MDDKRSTSGYCTVLGGNLVTQQSKKQLVIARSSAEAEYKAMTHHVCELLWLQTAEAEYRAMTHRICELLWLQTLLRDLEIADNGPMKLYCDN